MIPVIRLDSGRGHGVGSNDLKEIVIFVSHLPKDMLVAGGVPPSVVHPCLHGAVRHCQIQNNLVIQSRNGVAIVQCGQHKMLFSE